MARGTNELFDTIKVKKLRSEVIITDKQRNATKEWLRLLSNNELEKEEENYTKFQQIVLQDILGFSLYEIVPQRDNLDFSIIDAKSQRSLGIEAKGNSVKDLFQRQHRPKKEQEIPVLQLYTYMGGEHVYDYGICTNYEKFILLIHNKGHSKHHLIDFLKIREQNDSLNEEKLKEFVGLFSKQRIFDEEILENLLKESELAEQEFTKEFYKLYHETRLMLIKEFSNQHDITKDEAIHWSQIFINRLIFIFFAEDNNLIPERIFTKRIIDILKSPSIDENTKSVFDNIMALFNTMNDGSRVLGINAFNGGLFENKFPPKIFFMDLKDQKFFEKVKQNPKIPKKSTLVDIEISLAARYNELLNPIIKNLLLMDSFDFTSEVNVKILGHIFEQSISDLEELRGDKISKRKREGVYYTPEYITDYICRNTIIPYLSKNNSTGSYELVQEYIDNIDELEKKFKEIKILDPACGSGAFLIKAVDILLEIFKEIQLVKESRGKYSSGDQYSLAKWSEESQIQEIIKNNIFGVDINEESVEITKLSLFLKLVGENRKLIDLSKNIKVGNSLVNDKSVDPKAFDWEKEFKTILENGGFDIVIGNPPYVRQEMISWMKPYLQQNYFVYHGVADMYVYFIEKGLSLVKDNGLFSIIVSNKFTKANYGEKLRDLLLMYNFKTFVDFGDLPVFEDTSTYPCIITVRKSPPQRNMMFCNVETLNFVDLYTYVKSKLKQIEISSLDESGWNFSETGSLIIEKILRDSISFGDLVNNEFYRGVTTGLNEAFVINEELREKLIEEDPKSAEIIFPYLSGKEIKRFKIEWEGNYLIFTRRGIDISQYPTIENHLSKFRKKLEPKSPTNKEGRKPGNYQWYEIQDTTDYWRIFLQMGIIYPHFNKFSNFTISPGNFFLNAKGYQVQSKELWLLAILNSKVISYFLRSICPFVRGGYYEYNSQYIEKIPIKQNQKYNDKLTEYTRIVLENIEKIVKTKNKIKNRIFSSFKVDISSKIENFHKLSFNDFLEEIYKKSKVRLSLKEQDEWEDYFKEYKNTISKLQNEIDLVDKEIDDLVYKLYALNDDEIRIVEENYPTT